MRPFGCFIFPNRRSIIFSLLLFLEKTMELDRDATLEQQNVQLVPAKRQSATAELQNLRLVSVNKLSVPPLPSRNKLSNRNAGTIPRFKVLPTKKKEGRSSIDSKPRFPQFLKRFDRPCNVGSFRFMLDIPSVFFYVLALLGLSITARLSILFCSIFK